MKKDGSSVTIFRVDPSSKYYDDAAGMVNGSLKWHEKITVWFNKLLGKAQPPVYGICSRNVLLPLEGDSNFHKAARGALVALRQQDMIGHSCAIQGEVVAPSIQENYEKVTDVEFHMFDMFDIDKQEYVLPARRKVFAYTKGINHATTIDDAKLRDIINYKEGDDIVKSILDYAEGPGDNPGVKREGVVFKAETKDFSFKAVSNSYLLATGK